MADMIEKTRVFREIGDVAVLADDPLVFLEYDHKAQRGVADLLEALADSLPDDVRPATATLAASLLRDSAKRRAIVETEVLEPLIAERHAPGTTLHRAITLARREASEVADLALELAEELEALALTGQARDADVLGFMLRAYFDGLRRHLDWVEVAILDDLRADLSPGEVERLGSRLARVRDATGLGRWSGLAVVRDRA
jgi:hypothetical protein